MKRNRILAIVLTAILLLSAAGLPPFAAPALATEPVATTSPTATATVEPTPTATPDATASPEASPSATEPATPTPEPTRTLPPSNYNPQSIQQVISRAANSDLTVTKSYSWASGCRNLKVTVTVKDSLSPRPIDVVILRDVSGSVLETYGGKKVNDWFDDGCEDLISSIFDLSNVNVKIASAKWGGNPTSKGSNADAAKLSNFKASSSESTLIADTNDVGTVKASETTNLEAGLNMGYNMLYGDTATGGRDNALKVAIVVTDGYPTVNNSYWYDESEALSAGNRYIDSAVDAANKIKAKGGLVIYWGMTGGLDSSTEKARAAETMDATASKDMAGALMKYATTSYSASKLSAAVTALSKNVQEISEITVTDALTSQATAAGLDTGNYDNESNFSVGANKMIATVRATSSTSTWTGSYTITIPSDALSSGYIDFPISTLTIKSRDGDGKECTNTISASTNAPDVTAPLVCSTPTSSTGSVKPVKGNPVTLTVPISGGVGPFTVKWTRSIDNWSSTATVAAGGTSASVTVTPTASATYTASITDTRGCTVTAARAVTLATGTVYVKHLRKSDNAVLATQQTLTGYTGVAVTTTPATISGYTMVGTSGTTSGTYPADGTSRTVTYYYEAPAPAVAAPTLTGPATGIMGGTYTYTMGGTGNAGNVDLTTYNSAIFSMNGQPIISTTTGTWTGVSTLTIKYRPVGGSTWITVDTVTATANKSITLPEDADAVLWSAPTASPGAAIGTKPTVKVKVTKPMASFAMQSRHDAYYSGTKLTTLVSANVNTTIPTGSVTVRYLRQDTSAVLYTTTASGYAGVAYTTAVGPTRYSTGGTNYIKAGVTNASYASGTYDSTARTVTYLYTPILPGEAAIYLDQDNATPALHESNTYRLYGAANPTTLAITDWTLTANIPAYATVQSITTGTFTGVGDYALYYIPAGGSAYELLANANGATSSTVPVPDGAKALQWRLGSAPVDAAQDEDITIATEITNGPASGTTFDVTATQTLTMDGTPQAPANASITTAIRQGSVNVLYKRNDTGTVLSSSVLTGWVGDTYSGTPGAARVSFAGVEYIQRGVDNADAISGSYTDEAITVTYWYAPLVLALGGVAIEADRSTPAYTEAVTYSISGVANQSNVVVDDWTLTVELPPEVPAKEITTGTYEGVGAYSIYFIPAGGTAYELLADVDGATDTTIPIGGDGATAIQWRLGSGSETAVQTTDVTVTGYIIDTPASGTALTATATQTATYESAALTPTSDTAVVNLRQGSVVVYHKELGTENVLYSLPYTGFVHAAYTVIPGPHRATYGGIKYVRVESDTDPSPTGTYEDEPGAVVYWYTTTQPAIGPIDLSCDAATGALGETLTYTVNGVANTGNVALDAMALTVTLPIEAPASSVVAPSVAGSGYSLYYRPVGGSSYTLLATVAMQQTPTFTIPGQGAAALLLRWETPGTDVQQLTPMAITAAIRSRPATGDAIAAGAALDAQFDGTALTPTSDTVTTPIRQGKVTVFYKLTGSKAVLHQQTITGWVNAPYTTAAPASIETIEGTEYLQIGDVNGEKASGTYTDAPIEITYWFEPVRASIGQITLANTAPLNTNVGEDVLFRLDGIANTGNVPITGMTVSVDIPDVVDFAGATPGAYSGCNDVAVSCLLASGEWVAQDKIPSDAVVTSVRWELRGSLPPTLKVTTAPTVTVRNTVRLDCWGGFELTATAQGYYKAQELQSRASDKGHVYREGSVLVFYRDAFTWAEITPATWARVDNNEPFTPVIPTLKGHKYTKMLTHADVTLFDAITLKSAGKGSFWIPENDLTVITLVYTAPAETLHFDASNTSGETR